MPTIFRIAVVLALLTATARAEPRPLTVAGFAGSFETSLRAELIPLFEQKHGVRVDYLPGNSAETLARLKTNPPDVAIADEGTIVEAIRSGFCGRIEGLPSDNLQLAARFKDDKAVALGLVATGFMYNTKFFRAKGWAPPSSWRDLGNPKYRKLIVMPPIANDYGLEALVMLARVNGGGEGNIDPGFKALKEEVGANVLAYEPSLDRAWGLFNRGEAQIVVWGSGRAQYYAANANFVGFAYPADGAPTALTAVCPAARSAADGAASSFIRKLLQPKMQLLLLQDYGFAPATQTIDVLVDRPAIAPVGDQADALIRLDWQTINAHRAEWLARWKREIEK